jgi:predicted enzyme related to lactoylglutathione lyase
MTNPVCYWELASHYSEKSVDFLSKVFGWEFKLDEKTGIHELPTGQFTPDFSGGVFTLRRAKLPFLTLYIQVEDIFAKAVLIEKSGGSIVEAPFQISGGSYICLFNEPSGVTLAMVQRSRE